MVPGNHDLDRDSLRDTLKSTSSTEPAYEQQLGVGLRNYSQFVTALVGDSTQSAESLVYLKKVEVDEVSIAILGLNTAWMSDSKGDAVSISPELVAEKIDGALKNLAGAQVKIALMHHSIEYLKKGI